ncbi:MAG TPA: DUF5709 domain-containing protein [Mycobacteriales bacterium]|nr:DUF5709 domain-containing protein [Mycobacteriales bacterium]
MSVDPGDYDEGAPDPQDAVLDPEEESTLDETDRLDPIDEDDFTNDPQASVYDASWVPPDRQPKQTDYGTTLSEMRDGEPLDRRLVEEEPDVFEQELGDPIEQIDESYDARLATEGDGEDPEVAQSLRAEGGDTDFPAPEFEPEDPRSGRLVEPDEGAHPDEEKDMVAYDEGIAGGASSAEEAAVHVVDEP